jgi:putative NADH-flavin reductase
MKIALFGGTGRTGGLLLAGALSRGHTVQLLARRPDAVPATDGVTVIAGDLLARDGADVRETLHGCDAVLAAIGSAALGAPGEAIGTGTGHIAEGCQAAGIRRVVSLGGGGILDAVGGGLRRDRPGYPAVFGPVSAQHLAAWQALAAARLEYTIVCTPDLTDGPATGQYRLVVRMMPEGGKRVSRADVAAVMLDALEQGRWIQERVGMAE